MRSLAKTLKALVHPVLLARAATAARLAMLAAFALTATAPSIAAEPARDELTHVSVGQPNRMPTELQMKRAVDEVRKDPNLGTAKEIRKLKWVGSDKPKVRPKSGFVRWLAELGRWIGESGRILVYVIVALAAIALALYLTRFLGDREPRVARRRVIAPTHVRDLDIRPESLPPDIGAAARELWQRSDHRAALSLLYRGMLSRLAHTHAVPIRASTTEGDCLALARKHLSTERAAYVTSLIKVWQRTVYGGHDPESHIVIELCDSFAAALDQPSAPPLQAQPA